MKGSCLKLIILLFFSLPDVLYSQTRITVTKPRLEILDDNLIIQYDILNAKSSDFFMVWLEVTDAAGNKVKALTVNGDIGNDIKGGKNKKITWDLGTDSILIDENIFVEVKAEKIVVQEAQPETRTTAVTETKEETVPDKEPQAKEDILIQQETKTTKADEGLNKAEISKGNILLSSVVLPGWGQSKTNKGKPYWIIGAAGYSCLAGSIILNLNSGSVYDDYKSEMDPDVSNDLFEKANQRNNISKYLAYSAVGIWVADVIWVLATPVKSAGSTSIQKNREFKITPFFDMDLNAAMVSLTYKF